MASYHRARANRPKDRDVNQRKIKNWSKKELSKEKKELESVVEEKSPIELKNEFQVKNQSRLSKNHQNEKKRPKMDKKNLVSSKNQQKQQSSKKQAPGSQRILKRPFMRFRKNLSKFRPSSLRKVGKNNSSLKNHLFGRRGEQHQKF